MTIVRIQKIIWGNKTVKHVVQKHKVTIEEAEKVIYSDSYLIEGHSGKKILVNRVGSRMISVVSRMTGNKLVVITARDSDKEEREGFYEFEKTQTTTKI